MINNKLNSSTVLSKVTTIGIILTFCCTPAVGYAQSDDISGLIQALEDKDVNTRRRAVKALEKAGPPAVKSLIAALNSEKSRARAAAAEALGEIKDGRAVEPLIAALQDKNAHVRSWAAEALGEIKDSRAVEPLTAALEDKDGAVRNSAAKALARIN
jgi:HEAT repeat protein